MTLEVCDVKKTRLKRCYVGGRRDTAEREAKCGLHEWASYRRGTSARSRAGDVGLPDEKNRSLWPEEWTALLSTARVAGTTSATMSAGCFRLTEPQNRCLTSDLPATSPVRRRQSRGSASCSWATQSATEADGTYTTVRPEAQNACKTFASVT